MRQDARAGLERLEPEAGEEAALRPLGRGARDAVGLLVDVDRRPRILVERPVGAPRRQRPRGPPVAVVLAVAGLLERSVEPDDVAGCRGTAGADRSASRTSYGGATTAAEVADLIRVIAEGAERTDLGHGLLGSDGRSTGGSGGGARAGDAATAARTGIVR